MRLVLVFAVLFSAQAFGCPLEGTWRTDIERTSASINKSTLLTDSKKSAVISILDEFEAIFTCGTITIRHVGDHDFGGPIPDTTSRYVLTELNDSTASLTIFDDSGHGHSESVRFDSTGCFIIEDKSRGYEEFKCKVLVRKQ